MYPQAKHARRPAQGRQGPSALLRRHRIERAEDPLDLLALARGAARRRRVIHLPHAEDPLEVLAAGVATVQVGRHGDTSVRDGAVPASGLPRGE